MRLKQTICFYEIIQGNKIFNFSCAQIILEYNKILQWVLIITSVSEEKCILYIYEFNLLKMWEKMKDNLMAKNPQQLSFWPWYIFSYRHYNAKIEHHFFI